MRKCFFLLLLLLTMLPVSMNAQLSSNSISTFNPEKLIFGGTFGFGLSNDFWSLGVSPQVGYKLTDQFHVGAGVGYSYAKRNSDYSVYTLIPEYNNQWLDKYHWVDVPYHYTEKSVSFNLFAHYYPWRNLIFSVKPEIMHTWYRATFDKQKFSEDRFVPAVVVGGGIHLRPFILQLNYELIQNEYSPYSDNVFFSVGVMF